jgi:hypothetical protein
MGIDKKPNILLLASTFRHFFIGLGLAFNDKSSQYHLVFIDQKFNDERNPVLQYLLEDALPFKSVSCLPLRANGVSKRKVRKLCFSKLQKIIDNLKPDEICVGNDRRVEFQFSMNYARNCIGLNTVGAYLDDGAGSYISFDKFRLKKSILDKYIDTPFKKIVYGSWFERPEWIGGSTWVDKLYLTLPQLVPSVLSEKSIVPVMPSFYKVNKAEDKMLELSERLGGRLDDIGIMDATLLVLPPKSIMEGLYGSLSELRSLILGLSNKSRKLFVKYHPRDVDDPLDIKDKVTLLPAAIPLEIFFSIYDFKEIIGDVSTALLSAKWLKPHSNVKFIDTKSEFTESMKSIFKELKIYELDEFDE